MTFATRCPKCNTVFQVGGDMLSLRSGLVRCGVCQTPFNGIENLLGRIAPQQETAPLPAETSAEPTADTPQSPAPVVEPSTPVPATTEPVMAPAAETAAANLTEPVNPHEPVLSDSEKALQEAFAKQLASFSLELDTSAPLAAVPAAAKATTPKKAEPTLAATPVETDPTEKTAAPAKKKKGHPFLLSIGILILLVALCLQGVYFYSKDIVESVPDLEEPVEQVCEVLSCPVEQAEAPVQKPVFILTESRHAAEKDKANTFTQTAVLTNTSSQHQPLPELALEIIGKEGKVLARRPVLPQEYTVAPEISDKGLAPAQSTVVTLHFEYSHDPAVSSRLVTTDPSKPSH